MTGYFAFLQQLKKRKRYEILSGGHTKNSTEIKCSFCSIDLLPDKIFSIFTVFEKRGKDVKFEVKDPPKPTKMFVRSIELLRGRLFNIFTAVKKIQF